MTLKGLKLKVCGMRDAENISELAMLEPDYMGFIFYPQSKRYAADLDVEVLNALPSEIKKTGVFVNAAYTEISQKIDTYKLDAIQLHGTESPEFCIRCKQLDVEVIKAFGVDKDFDFSDLSAYKEAVDYFLFDTKTDLHGGSGKTFDWNILQKYSLQKPYFLSGGLSADNLTEIKQINDPRLYALDLNSRFELEPGLKNIEKLTAVFNEIKIPD
ncbi:phosphoribosylanthranilate isomerase [Pedobacter sp. P351]|uniref:phosphoribosylanthranilate isomerase n=1 Tax=Pedobacter superstes TaxID=3133441 RepID=UPI0030A847FC